MKFLFLKVYLKVIEMLQSLLLGLSKVALRLYGPLPDLALRARLALKDLKKD